MAPPIINVCSQLTPSLKSGNVTRPPLNLSQILTLTSKPGQGGSADNAPRDLRAELLLAEAAHFAKLKGGPAPSAPEPAINDAKRQLEGGEEEETPEAKRRRILEETRDIDADSEPEEEEDSDSDSDDEDETAELQRELEKIKRERAEKREAEVCHIYIFTPDMISPWSYSLRKSKLN